MWDFLLSSLAVFLIFYVVKKRFLGNKLHNVWWELNLCALGLHISFSVTTSILKTYAKAGNDLLSYLDDFESCRDPVFRNNKAKAGLSTCLDADIHYKKSQAGLTWERVHEIGWAKIFFGYSFTQVFVNLTESSYWTFVIVLAFFATVLSIMVFAVKMYGKTKEPKFDWNNIKIRDENDELRKPALPVGKAKAGFLPL